MQPDKSSGGRVSRGAEGVPRRVTPEENRRILIRLLREGRCDVARQAGWDLAVDVLRSDDLADKAGWAETMDLGRVGTEVARAVLREAADALTGQEKS